jgi:two-component system NtrC family response regulator
MTAVDVLIIDDDPSVTASLALLCKKAGITSASCADPRSALAFLEESATELIIQDMNFTRETSGDEGLALIRQIKQRWPSIPVILMTAWGSIDLAVEGMKEGAADFVTKPWDNQRLLQVVQTTLALANNSAQPSLDRESLDEVFDFSSIIGQAPSLLSVLTAISRIAKTNAGVLVLGESGTGKELIADAIHANSDRANKPLIKVNLGAIPSSLFESELFGHVKGAFTDAKRDRKGRIEEANGGTLFLDEVGELDKVSQVKLLRVLQDRRFQPVGSDKTLTSDFRVIAATNRDLAEQVERGEFREDLYYRLNLISLQVPPLSERKTDIPAIAAHHLRELRETHQLPEVELTAKALSWLQAQTWAGNIRQLKHTLERTVLLSAKALLDAEDFESFAMQSSPRRQADWPPVGQLTLNDVEVLMITRALKQYNNNLTRVAQELGLSRAALYRRLEKHEIEV